MKKTIFAIMLLAATYSLCAQEPVLIRAQSSSSNAAYLVPDPIRISYETSYPDALLVTTWEPTTEWWRATYKGDNRLHHIYYSSQAYYLDKDVNFRVSLPVINTYVPEEVITSAIDLYGNNLYSVTRMKSVNDMDVYQVNLLENGIPRSTWMDAQGVVVTDNVYKVKVDEDKLKLKSDNE